MSTEFPDDRSLIEQIRKEIEEIQFRLNKPRLFPTINFGSRTVGPESVSPGIIFPIREPIKNYGTVGNLTLAVFLNKSDSHVHKMILNGDISLSFQDPPGTVNKMTFVVDITQDAIGGRAVSFVQTVTPTPTISTSPSARTIIILQTTDGGITYHFIAGSNISAGTDISNLANKTLSNLNSPTAINQDLIPGTIGTKNIGSATNYFATANLTALVFRAIGSIVTTKPSMAPNSSDDLIVNVPSTRNLLLYFNGIEKARVNASLADFTGITSLAGTFIIVNNSILLNDGLIDPIFDGEIKRKGDDILAISGGAIRNFSDISAGANRNLSNLLEPTAINQDLQFSDTSKDIGDSINALDNLFAQRIRFPLQAAIVTNAFNIVRSTADILRANVPSGKSIGFLENGVNSMGTFSKTLVDFSFVDDSTLMKVAAITQKIVLNDGGYTPITNGEMARSGAHVQVFSGGALRNFTDIGISVFKDSLFGVYNGLVAGIKEIRFNASLLTSPKTITWLNRSGKPILIDSITDTVACENKIFRDAQDPVQGKDLTTKDYVDAKAAGTFIFDPTPDLETFIMPTNWSIGYTGTVVLA